MRCCTKKTKENTAEKEYFVEIFDLFNKISVEICECLHYTMQVFSLRGDATVLHIVLVEPEIPQNCGNIARTCAATGSSLHLVRPLGFDISERAVRRAGLDYWHLVQVYDYANLDELFARHPEAAQDLWLTTTKAPRSYCQASFTPDSWLFFGKETAGLPEWFRRQHEARCIRLPMREEARSLNLSNAVAVTVYEALRQTDFPGLRDWGEMKDNPTEKETMQ